MGYSPPQDEQTKPSTRKLPTPKIGDIVRYYDIDGGSIEGQILVGKISLIQPTGTNKQWLVELTELQDVGSGYYAEYPSRKRRRSALRYLEDIAPLAASFVRTEDAYKVPLERGTNVPMPYVESYDVENYEGPTSIPIDKAVIEADGQVYSQIKASLFKNTALAGLAGTILVNLLTGSNEYTVIYLAGAAAGLLYLVFLGIKTDTLGGTNAKLGSNVSNLRFVFPLLVLVGVAFNNYASGWDGKEFDGGGVFSTVTPQQFGAAMIGFLTYRIPLFLSQLVPVLFDTASDVMLPGSAGMAVSMAMTAAEARQRGVDAALMQRSQRGNDGLVTVLLVSGPEGTGKTTLVNRLIDGDGSNRFVRPVFQDRTKDAMTFQRMEERGDFLAVDESGQYGLSKEGLLQAVATAHDDSDTASKQQVVVVDADVSLAKKLANLPEVRLVGVWVGLDSLDKFEERLKTKMQSGDVFIPVGETTDSVLRGKLNGAIKDIEFGVVSGLFEFTILNDNIDESVKELEEAAEYCFK